MWMLDTGSLDRLARVALTRDPIWVWPRTLLHTAGTIVSVESNSNNRIPPLLAQRSEDGGAWIQQHEILIDSEAATILAHLRPNATVADKNYGEDCCIALCMTTCSELTFVSNDKRAVWRALFELGPGRIACELVCWAWLRDNRHIENSDFNRLYQYALKDLQIRPPPWRFHVATAPEG